MGFTSKLSNASKDKSAPSSPRPSYSNGSAGNECSKAQQQQLSLSISSSNQSGSGSSGYATHSALSPRISNSQKTAIEIFKIIAEKKLCVVRKFGAEANTLITTIIEAVCRKCEPVIEPTYLHVNQLCAGEMLDSVQRQGLPLIFVNGDCIGGLNELRALDKSGFLVEALKPHDFDLIVVGGGTGGVAAALEAAELGKKVACLDFKKPNSIDYLNDSSVNMGSVWKRLMHQTALLGEAVEDAKCYGWEMPDEFTPKINWGKLRNSIQEHASKASLRFRTELMDKQVTHINSRGFLLAHTK